MLLDSGKEELGGEALLPTKVLSHHSPVPSEDRQVLKGVKESKVVVTGAGRKGMRSWWLMSIEFQLGPNESVLEMDGGDGCTTV